MLFWGAFWGGVAGLLFVVLTGHWRDDEEEDDVVPARGRTTNEDDPDD